MGAGAGAGAGAAAGAGAVSRQWMFEGGGLASGNVSRHPWLAVANLGGNFNLQGMVESGSRHLFPATSLSWWKGKRRLTRGRRPFFLNQQLGAPSLRKRERLGRQGAGAGSRLSLPCSVLGKRKADGCFCKFNVSFFYIYKFMLSYFIKSTSNTKFFNNNLILL